MPRVPVVRSGSRGWWRTYFHDHPKLSSKNAIAYAGIGTSAKAKVYCIRCFEEDILEIQLRERQEVEDRTRVMERERTAVEAELWTLRDENSSSPQGWTRSATTTLLNHLVNCRLQPESIQNQARAEKEKQTSNAHSPARRRTHQPNPVPVAGPSSLNSDSQQLRDPIFNFFNNHYPSSSGAYPSRATSPAASITPSESISESAPYQLPRANSSRPVSRAASVVNSRVGSVSDVWSKTKQARFERRIARITASGGLAYSWIENPEVIAFFDDFLPHAEVPSRKTLANRLIPDAVSEIRMEVIASAKGKNLTLQEDGWTGENNVHLHAFMVFVDGKLRTVRVHDASTERKTTENLLRLIEEVVEMLETKWGAIVIAVVTDASGEARKARRLFGMKYPWIIVLDCYAHQVNLIVGDYFKSDAPVLQFTDEASELITWLRGRTIVLGLIRQAQIDTVGPAHTKAVIRAVLTRWTSHYLAYNRLCELRGTMLSIVYADEARADCDKLIMTGNAKAKRKSREMIDIIKSSVFWHSLARIVRHLRPLAIAANVVQAAFCRLHQVLLTFGYLTMQYRKMTDPDDIVGCTAIMESIERRWAKADQEIFIAAVILNPLYQSNPFRRLTFLNNAGIHTLLEKLWKRVFRQDPPDDFHGQLKEYLNETGMFVNLATQCKRQTMLAEMKNQSPDPIEVLNDFCFSGQSLPSFIRLANHILSISANSASCERLFSVFGNTLTKLRNRLGTESLTQLTELKMHIRDQHLEEKTKSRIKRQFSARRDTPNPCNVVTTETPVAGQETQDNLTNDITIDDTGDDPQATPSPTGFRGIALQHTNLAARDDEDNDPVRRPETLGGPIPIDELFNFENEHWVSRYSKTAITSFDEELELYELLDLDAEGEDDADIDIDDTMEQILAD